MRLLGTWVFLIGGAGALFAQSSPSGGNTEEHCTLRFAGSHCDGLGCEGQSVIRYGAEGVRREELINLSYPSSSDDRHLGSPEAVIAKALLQLGKQGWELESITPESKSYPTPDNIIYHLRRQRKP